MKKFLLDEKYNFGDILLVGFGASVASAGGSWLAIGGVGLLIIGWAAYAGYQKFYPGN